MRSGTPQPRCTTCVSFRRECGQRSWTLEDQLADQPEVATRHRKRMRANPVAPWELRVGDFRVFYDVATPADEKADPEVVILAIGVKRHNRTWIGGEEQEL